MEIIESMELISEVSMVTSFGAMVCVQAPQAVDFLLQAVTLPGLPSSLYTFRLRLSDGLARDCQWHVLSHGCSTGVPRI